MKIGFGRKEIDISDVQLEAILRCIEKGSTTFDRWDLAESDESLNRLFAESKVREDPTKLSWSDFTHASGFEEVGLRFVLAGQLKSPGAGAEFRSLLEEERQDFLGRSRKEKYLENDRIERRRKEEDPNYSKLLDQLYAEEEKQLIEEELVQKEVSPRDKTLTTAKPENSIWTSEWPLRIGWAIAIASIATCYYAVDDWHKGRTDYDRLTPVEKECVSNTGSIDKCKGIEERVEEDYERLKEALRDN